MVYSLAEIKDDLITKPVYEFYQKYILRSDNWYFETILLEGKGNVLSVIDDFKTIISQELGISFNNIAMVGSGKLGFSLAPHKCFNAFDSEGKIRKISDLDVAIVSDKLFQTYWSLLRNSYKPKYEAYYEYIPREIYRGYINEVILLEIEGCRKEWKTISNKSKKSLYSNLYIKHEVKYRLYRSWEDFEQYNLQSLDKIKREINNGIII